MKTYKINKIPYSLRDFTLGEKNKVAFVKREIALELVPEENKDITINVSLSDERLCEILSFILESENGEAANITPADLQNTGEQTFSGLLIDFLTNEIQFALEKKRHFENSLKELNLPAPNLNLSPKLTRTTSRRK